MAGASEPQFWLWPDPDKRWFEKVLKYVAENTASGQNLTVLYCTQFPLTDQNVSLAEYIVSLCFEHNLLENKKITFLSFKDHILALQLCIARLRQKKVGQFSASSSNVLDCHEAYTKQFPAFEVDSGDSDVSSAITLYEDFLKQSNCINLWQIYNLLLCSLQKNEKGLKDSISEANYIVLGVPHLKVSRQILKLLATNKSVHHVVVEVPLDISIQDNCPEDVPDITGQVTQIEDLLASAATCVIEQVSATKEYAEDVMVAFLTLLVNSRNELALSKVMVSPLIDFTHDAFTALKRMSVEKEMPMCQTAISYVTRIRLGGKSYAPSENCPLRLYLKALEQFVDLLNQLQTIIEEDADTKSATSRVINILKNRLVKCGSSRLRQSSVEDAAVNLKDTVLNLLQKHKTNVESKTSNSQHGLDALHILHQLVNHVNYSCSAYDPLTVLEKSAVHRTPLNLPPLMGYFKSPEDESSCDSRSTQGEISKCNQNLPLAASPVIVSYVHSHDSNSVFQSKVNSEGTLQTNFKNCLQNDKIDNQKASTSGISKKEQKTISGFKPGKRSILKDISNETFKKPGTSKSKKAKVSGQSKKIRQIDGQSQITKFFSVRA